MRLVEYYALYWSFITNIIHITTLTKIKSTKKAEPQIFKNYKKKNTVRI